MIMSSVSVFFCVSSPAQIRFMFMKAICCLPFIQLKSIISVWLNKQQLVIQSGTAAAFKVHADEQFRLSSVKL